MAEAIKYVARTTKRNFNLSEVSLGHEVLRLAAGLFLLAAGTYLVLGLLVDALVPHLSPETERAIGSLIVKAEEKKGAENPRLTALLEQLVRRAPELTGQEPAITVVARSEANAAALPGCRILVFDGLLRTVRSENELAMVLGHELGHCAARDSLRAAGRGLLLAALAAVAAADSAAAARMVSWSMNAGELFYSREQERRADSYALDLLIAVYGHAGGALDFFEADRKRRIEIAGLAYLQDHPAFSERIESLRAIIRKRRLPVGATVPWKGD